MNNTYTATLEGERLDCFLAEKSGLSRSHIKKIIDDGGVTVNNLTKKSNYIIKKSDVVCISLPEPKPLDVKPVNIPLDIIFQDEYLAVINKPQGLTVHAGSGTDDNTLVNALLYSLDSLSGINGVIRPGIVHRIDKDTSGLLVVAKNDFAHLSLAEQIANKTCKRVYLALLHGKVKEDSGCVDTFIDRDPKDRTAFKANTSSRGRRAVTDYKVIKRFENYTLCEFSLHTGRTHQIRVHCKYLGNPVVGDKVYGPKKCPFDLNGQLLHAYKLTFKHPKTQELITFTCDVPDYFAKTIEKLKEV